jgi:phenylpropionate dioxygenase-like ring-hydroxylating dioxygenase large terminal subunit
MAFTKPAEGSWTEHYPHLGTGPVSYEDCISPEFYRDEREAVFRRAWLNVGRVEDVARSGSYFTKEIVIANSSIVIVRDAHGVVRAFHNICRHRGNKLVWNDYPNEETSGSCRAFTCKYHAWRYDLDGACAFVQEESEFFDLDKSDLGLVPVHCDVWAGFIFVNLADDPEQSLLEFLGPMITALDGYPFEKLTERYDFRADIGCNWKVFSDAFQEYYHVPYLHPQEATPAARPKTVAMGFEAPHYQLDGPHRMVSTSGAPRRVWPAEPIPDRDRDPQRTVRPLERAEPGRQPARREPWRHRRLGDRQFPGVPEPRDPDLGDGVVPRLPVLADLAQHSSVRGHPLLCAVRERQ